MERLDGKAEICKVSSNNVRGVVVQAVLRSLQDR